MIKKITIPPTSTPVEVTAESIDGKLTLSPNGLVATVAPSDLTLSATPGTPIVAPPPVVVDPPPVVVPPVSGIPSTARLVFASDFSTGFGGFQTVNGSQYAQLGKGVIATDPDNPANKVFNAIVPKGAERISSGYRSELTLADTPMTGEMYFSFRCRFKKNSGTDQGHFFQIHPSNDTGSASFAIYFNGGIFSVVRSLKKGENIYETPTKPIVLNKWYNFMVHAKWSATSNGLIEVFIDGEKFLSKAGQTLPSEGGYLKFGPNMWSGRTGMTPDVGIDILYDDLKIYRA